MNNDACPLPTPPAALEREAIGRMVKGRRIAVVGLSDDPTRPSYGVAEYLIRRGKEIVPVNPGVREVMGMKAYARLEDIPGKVDVVDVFRRAEFCGEIARAAVAIGAKGLWLQSGVVSEEARRVAREGGIDFVENRCLAVEVRRS